MSELSMTTQEKERVQMFIAEQRAEWDEEERHKAFLAERRGEQYEPQPFPGFDENAALQAIRSGWKSQLDKMFDKKFKREGIRK